MTDRSQRLAAACLAASALLVTSAHADDARRPDQLAFREIYRELVETNTTLSAGSCTAAAEKMAARLRAAGYPDTDLHLFAVPEHPKEGGLVAVLPGADPKARPMLLLAHIDVVEARREDWERDPFTLFEEGGYFYARGALDDKSMAATWVDTLIRLRGERTKPRRTIKMALTCGEETSGAFNGAQYLANERRDLIDAAFALNEGAWGLLDASGKRVMMGVQAGEKTSQDFQLEVQNPGGHSSRPVKNNAIYHLAGALTRIEHYDFPIQLNDTTRTYFSRMASIVGGATGAAMTKVVANPTDAAAGAVVAEDPSWNGMLRTTCVATMLDAGHATNALPQRARANVNCRIYPGESIDSVRQTLERVVADPEVKVTTQGKRGPESVVPPLTREIMAPIEKVSARFYPGVPVMPILQPGATDGQFLGAAGIPTYGVNGLFLDPDLGGIHGLNERVRVQSLYDGRDFLYELVKVYAAQTR
jgi:acetylornithine deacetylase/succinyl-diaminopimelate desuccinylase-like protein